MFPKLHLKPHQFAHISFVCIIKHALILHENMNKNQIKIDGRIIDYIESGKGESIILVPGVGSNCTLWEPLMSRLSNHYHTISLTIPVYNTRNNKGQVYTIRTLHKLLHKIILHLKLKNPVIVGHSLGGLVSLSYAKHHPNRIKKLVLVSTPLSDRKKRLPISWRLGIKFAKTNRAQDIINYVNNNPTLFNTLTKIIFPKRNPKLRARTASFLLKGMPVKSLAKFYNDLFTTDLSYLVTQNQASTLFIYGTQDEELLSFNGTALYPLSPNAKIEPLDCHHFIPADKPHELYLQIKNFIA